MRTVGVGVVIALAGLVAACAGEDERASPSSPAPTAIGAPISRATWTAGAWPFNVPEGTLKCYSEDSMVTFSAAGIEYGLNATAKVFGRFRDINEIVADGPEGYVEIDGGRQSMRTNAVSLDAIHARVHELCD